MSYDPNQQPNSGYGNPPYGTPPQGPYGQPQGPYGPLPQGPYGQPPGPYGPPPQGPYGQPPYPYGYGAPPQGPYGAPPYQQPGYGYVPPPAAPLPLGEAIRQLPQQYIKVLTKPSAATFAEEMGKAAWNIVWVQVLFTALAVVIPILLIGLLVSLIAGAAASSNSNTPMGPILAVLAGFFVLYAILLIVLVPAGFFAGTGIQYLIAKVFGGQGTFLTHSYSSLLLRVPVIALIFIGSLVLGFIPFLNLLVFFLLIPAVLIYSIVLDIFMLMAVHRLSGGRATLVYFTPVIAALLLSCVFASLGILLRPH